MSADTYGPCRKDDRSWPFLCSCKTCCRQAAGAWNARMDRVLAGEITLFEAQEQQKREDTP